MGDIISYNPAKLSAETLLNTKIIKPPVPIVKIAQNQGILVFEGEISNNEILALGFCQMMAEKDSYQIILNQNATFYEKRFLIAYLVLEYDGLENKEEFNSTIYRNQQFDDQIYDKVLDLLLPNFLLRKEKKEILKSEEDISKKYQVNEYLVKQKMKRREYK